MNMKILNFIQNSVLTNNVFYLNFRVLDVTEKLYQLFKKELNGFGYCVLFLHFMIFYHVYEVCLARLLAHICWLIY